jgi:hypothetical protein
MEQPALRIRIEKTMFEAANHREIDGASENGSTEDGHSSDDCEIAPAYNLSFVHLLIIGEST